MTSRSPHWNEVLLRTGLPFEYFVASALEASKFHVYGEFNYRRTDREGRDTDFSVDFEAISFASGKATSATLRLLVECKYNSENTKWILAPYTPGVDHLVAGTLEVWDHLCTRQYFNEEKLIQIDQENNYCVKGVSLFENVTGSDRSEADGNSISRGLSQLRYAAPNFARGLIESQAWMLHDDDLMPDILVLVLVTSAPIYILKDKLDLNAFKNAKDILEIATKVPYAIVYQPMNPDLRIYSEKIIEALLKENPEIEERLKRLEPFINKPYWKGVDRLRGAFRSVGEHIVIVSFDKLPTFLAMLRSIFRSANKGLRRYAVLKRDASTGKVDFSAPTKK